MTNPNNPVFINQSEEFRAVEQLHNRWREQPSIVDDDYPEWRHNYERDLFALVKAVRENHGEETFSIRSR